MHEDFSLKTKKKGPYARQNTFPFHLCHKDIQTLNLEIT